MPLMLLTVHFVSIPSTQTEILQYVKKVNPLELILRNPSVSVKIAKLVIKAVKLDVSAGFISKSGRQCERQINRVKKNRQGSSKQR